MASLFGGMKGGSSDSDSSESVDAAQDVLDAISDNDAHALDLALQRHYELCQSEHEEPADDETEDMPLSKSKEY